MSRKESILKRINKDLDKEIRKKQDLISKFLGKSVTYQDTSKTIASIIAKIPITDDVKKYFNK